MQRIYYLGQEPSTDSRLAGVELTYLTQIDVPEDLAKVLIGEAAYSELPGPPVPMPEATAPSEPEDGITWYEPKPGEEHRVLSGISDGRAKWLADYGIATLADMAALPYEEMVILADEMPRIGMVQIEEWVGQAKEHPGWIEIEPTE